MNDTLQKFYSDVNTAARRLEAVHSERLHCARGCSSCCVDGITVFEVEAGNIVENHQELLESAKPHEEGACAFLDDEGACRIYEDRPYVCRTQGLPLRWHEEKDEGYVEYRDICPLNDEADKPLESLPENECWTIGEFEGRLAGLQIEKTGRKANRIPLRSLFTSTAK